MKQSKKTNYQVQNEYEIEYEKLSDLRSVKGIPNGNDLFVLKIKEVETKTGLYNESNIFNVEEIVTEEVLKEILEHPERKTLLKKMNYGEGQTELITKEYLEVFSNYDLYQDLLVATGGKKLPAEDHKSKNILKDIKNPNYELVQFIPSDFSYTFVSSDGKYYMSPIMLDYIEARLNNEKYNLDDLTEYLSKRNDISFIVKKGYSDRNIDILKAPLKGNENNIDKIISDIPYYNASEECSEYINILYYPSQEDIKKMLGEGRKDKKDMFNRIDFILNNILNVTPFLKEPVVEKEVVVPRRKYKN